MKDEKWYVEIYEFNENTLLWVPCRVQTFSTNEALLQFIRAMAEATRKYRYTITFIVNEKLSCAHTHQEGKQE